MNAIINQLINRKKLLNKLMDKEKICNFIGSDGALVLELVRINSHDLFASAIFIEIVNEAIENMEHYNRFIFMQIQNIF